LGELRSYVRGWMGYYGIASQLKLFASLEQCRVFSCRRLGKTHSVLLLEELATCSHTHPRTHSSGRLTEASYPARHKSQRTLAHGQNDRKWCRNDERMVSRSGSLESQDIMGRTCSSSLNRRMQIRMSGGVVRVVSNDHSYPMLRHYCGLPYL